MKQTAVEWMANEITSRITRRNPHDTIIIQTQGEILIELIEQAKEMEKEQIIEFTNDYVLTQCSADFNGNVSAEMSTEEYYELTFKSE